jgi:hypothetical protein
MSIVDCAFRVTPGKVGTARAVAFAELGITKSHTLEVSQAGFVDHAGAAQHFLLDGAWRGGSPLMGTLLLSLPSPSDTPGSIPLQ